MNKEKIPPEIRAKAEEIFETKIWKKIKTNKDIKSQSLKVKRYLNSEFKKLSFHQFLLGYLYGTVHDSNSEKIENES